MKKLFGARAVLFALVLFTLAAVATCASPGRPLRPARTRATAPFDDDFADPFVLQAGGAYYGFATGARGLHVQLARSRALADWTLIGDALPQLPAWARDQAGVTWAPSVLARGGGYVLYYTTRDAASGYQCISRALAFRPEGPYVDTSPRPLVCQIGTTSLCGSIDPSPFVDHDGTAYLLWKSDENSRACRSTPRIWSQRLSPDGLELLDQPAALLARDRDWEGDIIEGPSMTAHDGHYYLFYSANWYASSRYAIGYATCAGPMGACTKVTVGAPFLGSGGAALGPGGQELFTATDGALWMAYHAWSAPRTSYEQGGVRSLRLARIGFGTDGAPLALAMP